VTGAARSYALYISALPAYRRECLERVNAHFGEEWATFSGSSLLDRSVRTDLPHYLYEPVSNHLWFGGRVLFQWGHWPEVIKATTAVLELNPRSLTAWMLLIARKLLRRRTLLWGHLDPRSGPNASTAPLRAAMRDLADGCILYTYESARRLQREKPRAHVWVAPNALYPRETLRLIPGTDRNVILYVGRLEPAKKPDLLLEGFRLVAQRQPQWRLVMVGDGTMRESIACRAEEMGLAERVSLPGETHDSRVLAEWYAQAYCSVSPGYVGLALTQTLGFGVPMVIANGEPHAPEIELAHPGNAVFFKGGSPSSLAGALEAPQLALTDNERMALIDEIRRGYTAESMAQGLIDAVTDVEAVWSERHDS
jgi:glycosyltransferase involved in cell wall biosynthesis